MSEHDPRHVAENAVLDAAERLLIATGYAAISTRRLAEEAHINHGMVHYYFGSMEQIFLRVLARFTTRLITRQQALYATNAPFIEKWRTAIDLLEADHASGYQKLWFELQAMAWNRPDMREQLAAILGQWRTVLTDAFANALQDYDLDTDIFPVDALVTLVITFNEGIMLERLNGIRIGHAALFATIEQMIIHLETTRKHRKGNPDESLPPQL